MKLTEHFRESEIFVVTKSGDPTDFDKVKAFYLCSTILEPVRAALGSNPIRITSGKRSFHHNNNIGGAKTSDHLFNDESCAVDFDCGNDSANRIAFFFLANELRHAFGQAIAYIDKRDQLRFIHVSLPTRKHQSELLLAQYESPRRYKKYIADDERKLLL